MNARISPSILLITLAACAKNSAPELEQDELGDPRPATVSESAEAAPKDVPTKASPAVVTASPRSEAGKLSEKRESAEVDEDVAVAAQAPMGGAVAMGWGPPPPPAPDVVVGGTEGYTDYGVNDMTIVEKDHLSTFSIDVDTASYSIARRKLDEGQLPATASVRVEEFVNFFAYSYAPPLAGSNGGAPFAVHMEAAPNPVQPKHEILRIGVKGLELDQAGRKDLNLTFLVDTSGSMSGPDRIDMAKRSLHYLVNNLSEQDTVSIATYAGSTMVVLKPTSAVHKQRIHAAIDSLETGGGTNMGDGMMLAYDMASDSYETGAENRVIVLSDGDANIGMVSHDQMLKRIRGYAAEGITMTTVGFGMGNYKDTMMEQLANEGDGNNYYIDSFDQAKKVFGEQLSATMQVIAKDVKIQVEFNPDAVLSYRLVGYENRDIADQDFRDDKVDAGEIGAGHTVTAVYDVVLRDGAQSKELATVRIRAKKPGPDSAAQEWATVFDGEMMRAEYAEASKDLQMAFVAASFAELLRGSPYTAELTWSELYNLAQRASRGYESDTELLGLIATAARLSGSPVDAAIARR